MSIESFDALGIHVFAGGFTMGVRAAGHRVPAQLEIHGFGRETVEARMPEVEFINRDDWHHWPSYRGKCHWCFGNPRCTGFSAVTGGLSEKAHGPWATCTKDIHDFCQYAVREGIDLAIWESVQGAYTVGRDLLNYLRDEYFAPAGYRIAHVFLNACSFGNVQKRKRYFFVAYRGGNFNVYAPELPAKQTHVGDVLGSPYLTGRKVKPARLRGGEYDADSHDIVNDDDLALIPHLPEKCDTNKFARLYPEAFAMLSPRLSGKWNERMSDKPFSMHCIKRLQWDRSCPTIASSARKFVHPREDRTLTVRELAALMGWPEDVTPLGDNPVGQIAKGIVPAVGTWLAQQVGHFLRGEWGTEDYETQWCHKQRCWEGRELDDSPLEKVIHMGNFVPPDDTDQVDEAKGDTDGGEFTDVSQEIIVD